MTFGKSTAPRLYVIFPSVGPECFFVLRKGFSTGNLISSKEKPF